MKQCQEQIVITDIEDLLRNFLCKEDISEFIFGLEVSRVIEAAKSYRSGKNINQSKQGFTGLKLKELTDSIIAFAERKVSAEYLLKLMLDLIHLMILKKEFNLAAKISEDLIIKIGGNQNYSSLEVDAYLALAEIAWNLEYWEQSEKYVEKSYEIYHLNEAAGNEMKLPNSTYRYSKRYEETAVLPNSKNFEDHLIGYYSLIKAKNYINELLGVQSN
jgi:hypothetical protein